jgi:hypothetical protein
MLAGIGTGLAVWFVDMLEGSSSYTQQVKETLMPALYDCPACGKPYWNLKPITPEFAPSSEYFLIEGEFCPHCRASSPHVADASVYEESFRPGWVVDGSDEDPQYQRKIEAVRARFCAGLKSAPLYQKPSSFRCPVQVDPCAPNLYMRLIHSPGPADRTRESLPSLLKFRAVVLPPAQDRRVGQIDAPLGNHGRQIAIAQFETQVPAHNSTTISRSKWRPLNSSK